MAYADAIRIIIVDMFSRFPALRLPAVMEQKIQLEVFLHKAASRKAGPALKIDACLFPVCLHFFFFATCCLTV